MATGEPGPAAASGFVIAIEVSPFHCLYQDALHFHSLSRLTLPRSESETGRLARAALLLYIASAEALVHQAAIELGSVELAAIVANPACPLPLLDACQLLPAILGDGRHRLIDPDIAPWPQFAELVALRTSWAYPGPPETRRAYYYSPTKSPPYEPLFPHQIGASLALTADCIHFPKTGLPRDPYALRPTHLDTARAVLDAAIEALDRRLDGALTRDNRHRRELSRPV